MNLTLPPPLSITQCNCPTVDPNLSCHPWGATEWLICSSMLSSAFGVSITLLTIYINKLKKERPRMVTNLSTIPENNSIPEIMVVQR
jgi:hypothetical protein